MAGLAGQNAVVEGREQLLLIVVVDDGADDPERLDPWMVAARGS